QLPELLRVSTQTPLHALSLPGHPHVPVMQARSAAQTLPHVPQFAGSWAASTHTVPQRLKGASHLQTLFTQAAPGGQARPQAPQFLSSVARLVQNAPAPTDASGPASASAPASMSEPASEPAPASASVARPHRSGVGLGHASVQKPAVQPWP